MKSLVKDPSFYRLFFRLTLIVALQNVVILAVNLVDNMMLGQYSENALAGAALVNQIQYIHQMIVTGVGEGIMILIARHRGQGNKDAIRQVTGLGMQVGLFFTLIMVFMLLIFPRQILGFFTDDAQVLQEGLLYLRIVCLAYPFFCITNIFLASLRGVETVQIGFIISLSTLFTKVLLNYLLIGGHWGMAPLGIAGAGIATLSARLLETVIISCYVLKIDKKIAFRLKDMMYLDVKILKEYLHMGSPVLVSNFAWGIAQAIQTAILGQMGAMIIAANSVASTLYQILMVVGFASGSIATVLIGKTIGEGDIDRTKQYAKTMQFLFAGIGVITGTLLFLGRHVIVEMYKISPEAKQMATVFIVVMAVVAVGSSYQAPTLAGIVRGGGDTRFALVNDTIFTWGIVIPLSAFALWCNASPLIVFICLKSDQILKCIVGYIKVNYGNWIKIQME